MNPNEIKCEICENGEEEDVTVFCVQCSQYFCAGCQRAHKKPRTTDGHEFVSVEMALEGKMKVSVVHCEKHPQYGVNTYCHQDQQAICSECVVDSHVPPSREIGQCGAEVQGGNLSICRQGFFLFLFFLFPPILMASALNNKVKKHDGNLSEAIKVITTTMVGVRKQAEATEEEIHSTIERLISLLRDREAALLSDVEAVKYQKEKELQLQKDELEFLLSGIRHAVLFGEAMMKEGSDTEIVTGHQQIVSRMTTLINEREKMEIEPVTEANIDFVGVDQIGSAIKDLGSVVTTKISIEQSTIEKPTWASYMINQSCFFQVILADQKGNKVSHEATKLAVKSLAVGVAGPSKTEVHLAPS